MRVTAGTRGTRPRSSVLSNAVRAAQLDGRIRTTAEAGQWVRLTVTASSDVVPGLLAEIRSLDPKRPPGQWRGDPRFATAPIAASAPHSGASLTTSGFTPAVRTVAASLGVDLTRVVGTGIAGRVTINDVRAAADPTFPARIAAAQQVEDAFRHSTDPRRWPTGSAELDERIRTNPVRMYDVTAAVHRGPVAAAEPLLPQPKVPTVHFDGPAPAGIGSTPEVATTPYAGPRGSWPSDPGSQDSAGKPVLFYRES